MTDLALDATCLPADTAACLVGRVWLPGTGPVLVTPRDGALHDLSALAATASELLEFDEPAARVADALASQAAPRLPFTLAEVLANSDESHRDPQRPWLLAPNDLQAVKAAGVTFVASMLERVIEERARGDAGQALAVRQQLNDILGANLAGVVPGSDQAAEVKRVLQQQGMWSQYLEVGIGPDAEIFTKAPVLSSVGAGAHVGIRPDSHWNNPEPEVVLAVDSLGRVKGAALGNDVNLRDFEGRSALLLGKAKDNNASCAIGPFIRLFDAGFGIEQVRRIELRMAVHGDDGFEMTGSSSIGKISRDPLDLAAQAMNCHQYPDGFMLFMGTMFAPVQDRFGPGQGFTHAEGDVVRIGCAELGTLVNRVQHCDKIAPWHFGLRALMTNLAQRGLLA